MLFLNQLTPLMPNNGLCKDRADNNKLVAISQHFWYFLIITINYTPFKNLVKYIIHILNRQIAAVFGRMGFGHFCYNVAQFFIAVKLYGNFSALSPAGNFNLGSQLDPKFRLHGHKLRIRGSGIHLPFLGKLPDFAFHFANVPTAFNDLFVKQENFFRVVKPQKRAGVAFA